MLLGDHVGSLRALALRFCELTGREVEVVPLSRDTPESDLKQRRELHGGSVVYSDQAVVQAALHGRVLVLEGLEKAERNLLPILNNLLENREMALDDGAFLVHPARHGGIGQGGNEARPQARRRTRSRGDAAGRAHRPHAPIARTDRTHRSRAQL